MRFLQNTIIGLRAYVKAFRFIIAHKLYWYIGIPAVLMLGIYQIGNLIRMHVPETKTTNMNEIIWFLIGMLIEISIALLLMRFAKYLVVILLSPLISHLSQKVEYILTGNEYKFSMPQIIHDVKRGFRIAIRNILWEYFFFIVVYLIARLGWEEAQESPLFFLVFVVGFFYYGFSFLDYINERLRLTMDQSIQFARKNRGLAIAIGAVYSMMIWVPVNLTALFDWTPFGVNPVDFMFDFVLNLLLWICASFAPIWSVVAATIAMNDLLDLKKTREISIGNNDLSTK